MINHGTYFGLLENKHSEAATQWCFYKKVQKITAKQLRWSIKFQVSELEVY